MGAQPLVLSQSHGRTFVLAPISQRLRREIGFGNLGSTEILCPRVSDLGLLACKSSRLTVLLHRMPQSGPILTFLQFLLLPCVPKSIAPRNSLH